LTHEAERAWEAGAREPHGQEADRQQRHALVPSVVRGQIEPPTACFEDENRSGETSKRQPGRQPHQQPARQRARARAVEARHHQGGLTHEQVPARPARAGLDERERRAVDRGPERQDGDEPQHVGRGARNNQHHGHVCAHLRCAEQNGRPQPSVIEYFRHPRVKRHDPLPYQRGDHDQPQAGRFDRRVLHARTNEERDPDSKEQRREAQIHRDDASLILMRRVRQRGQERPERRPRQEQQHDGAFRQEGSERNEGGQGRPAQSAPIERRARRHRNGEQPQARRERQEDSRERVDANYLLSAGNPTERGSADRESAQAWRNGDDERREQHGHCRDDRQPPEAFHVNTKKRDADHESG
jgi:hypothetical protein